MRFATAAVVALLAATAATLHGQTVVSPITCSTSAKPANLAFTLTDLNGRDVRLDRYKGKILIVNFWATWCAPCRVEIPAFMDLYNRYRRLGVEVIGINVNEPADTVRPYAREMRISYPVLLGKDRQDVLDAFGPILGLPTTVVVNRDGSICQRYPGFTRKQTFEDLIRNLL
jgi:thiol-disulfide isomerase/thioredoxin